MNEEQKRRLMELKDKNQLFVQKKKWEKHVLLQECLTAIGHYVIVKEEPILKKVNGFFQEGMAVRHEINSLAFLKENTYYIVWDEATLPVIKCDGSCIIDNLEDVLCVSFDTYLLRADMEVLTEVLHDGRKFQYVSTGKKSR